MTKPTHIDPRRPWSRDRKFGWDAIYGPGASGVPVGSGGAESRSTGQGGGLYRAGSAKPCQSVEVRPAPKLSWGSAQPTVLPSVLSEGLNVVVAACLAAFVLLAAGVAHMEAPDREAKVYTERME